MSGSQGVRGSNPVSSTERETFGTLATAGVSVFLGSHGSQIGRPISVAFLVVFLLDLEIPASERTSVCRGRPSTAVATRRTSESTIGWHH
jgi:hypothetical protein